jgi:hypothetical protein
VSAHVGPCRGDGRGLAKLADPRGIGPRRRTSGLQDGTYQEAISRVGNVVAHVGPCGVGGEVLVRWATNENRPTWAIVGRRRGLVI